jgi:hypothetical protein
LEDFILKRKKKKDYRNAKVIGSQVNAEIWNELKIQAIKEGRKTGEVLDDAIRLYLEKWKRELSKLWVGFPFD